jgi:hypothetical protein
MVFFYLSYRINLDTYTLVLWLQKTTLINVQCDSEKTNHYLRLSAKNVLVMGNHLNLQTISQYTGHLVEVPEV